MQKNIDEYVYKRCDSSLIMLNVQELSTLLFYVYRSNEEVKLFVKFVATVFSSIFVDACRACVFDTTEFLQQRLTIGGHGHEIGFKRIFRAYYGAFNTPRLSDTNLASYVR